VCQEGWDGARRHPQPAAGVQSAEQWCSSQSQPQPQLRYQHVTCGLNPSGIGAHGTKLNKIGAMTPVRIA